MTNQIKAIATVRAAGKKFLHEVAISNGATSTRRSTKVYTHAVIAKEKHEDEMGWGVWSYHGTRKTAESQANTLAKGSVKWENDPMDVQIVEIEEIK